MGTKRYLYKEDGVQHEQAEEITYIAPCTALDSADPFFLVPVGATVDIPFDVVRVSHADYSITDGVVTPLRPGWYDVYGMLYDDYPNGAWQYDLHILGNGSIGIVESHIGAPAIRLHGRQLIYCNGSTDTISLAISHNANIDRHFNYVVGYHHTSYLNIHWIGESNSGVVE